MAEDGEENKDSGESGSSGGGMPMGLFLGVTGGMSVLLLGGGFAIAYFILPTQIASIVEEQQADMLAAYTAAAASAGSGEAGVEDESNAGEAGGNEGEGASEGNSDNDGGTGESDGSGSIEDMPTSEDFILSEIIVNLAGSRGGRYVKATMFFDGSKYVLGELEQHRPKVTDVVSEVLSSKTLAQFNSPGVRGELRRELIAAVNATLKRGKVDNIYFESLLVQ
ncbi:MAG: flagellar basal body-associated FliL family protein [Verrucomicrobiota bacterium]